MFPTFAVIVVVPAFFAVTNPLLVTVATDFLPEDQLTFFAGSEHLQCLRIPNKHGQLLFTDGSLCICGGLFYGHLASILFASDLCGDGCGSGFFRGYDAFFIVRQQLFCFLEDQVAFLLLPSTCRLVVCPIFSVAFFLLMDVFALAAAGNASTKIMILSRSSIRFLVLFIFSLLLRVNYYYTAQL